MSGIAGIYNLDGRPVDAGLLRRMTGAIAHRGPDGEGHWVSGAVGLGQRMLQTTPESLRERQPLSDQTGNLCLVLDGRVDNREELKEALESRGARLRDDTDAELVLRSYEVWGEESPARIIGDFAYAVWDGRKRQLFCARDFLGIKPFYFYRAENLFIFGSELQLFFEDANTPRKPNEGMIAEYLSADMASREETIYDGILRLPPAHSLLVQPGRFQKRRFWDIDANKTIKHRTDEQYAEDFLDIFTKAVRCRLRSHKPVGAYLSGGLDSSSVVGVSQAFCGVEIQSAGGFEIFSMLFPGIPECDESSYIDDVVKMWDLKQNAIYPEESKDYSYTDQVQTHFDIPDYPNGAMMAPLMGLAQDRGCRVLLTGYGGDEWLTGSHSQCPDLLRQLNILGWARQAYYESRRSNRNRFYSFKIMMDSFRPLVPEIIRRRVRKARKNGRSFDGLSQHLIASTRLADRLASRDTGDHVTGIARKSRYQRLSYGSLVHGREMQDRFASRFGLEDRHPFQDRRIVEYAFALPEQQIHRRDESKFVLRKAMKGIIPESVRRRITKANFSHVFPKALQTQGGESAFSSLIIGSLDWVDEEKVRSVYKQMASLYKIGDQSYTKYMWVLWMVFGLELWVRTLLAEKAAGPSCLDTGPMLKGSSFGNSIFLL